MRSQKVIFLFFILIASSAVTAQVSDCPYIETLSGNKGSSVDKAEAKITTEVIHNNASTVIYSAPIVEFADPFTINPLSDLEISTEGCEAECIKDANPCEIECESSYDTETNERGIRFIRHEVILTFPNDKLVLFDPQDLTISVGGTSGTQYSMTNLLSEFFNGPIQNGELKRCLCDENIFFYRNESMIFEEGGIQQTNRASGGVKEEGGSFSLNYIIDYAETPFQNDEFVYRPNYQISDRSFKDGTGRIVAFLDSGINPEFMPPNSLYHNADPGTFVCSLTDPSGWNFVKENDDLIDDRGHGTLTALSYLSAYSNLNGSEKLEEQRLLTVKILDGCGEGSLYNALCGLKYAKSKGAEIINCSWGLYQPDRNLQRVIEEITKNNDVQVVCSAGNAGKQLDTDTHFPSGFAREHLRYIDEEQEEIGKAINGVWEVAGACRNIGTPCSVQRLNTPLSTSSNFAERTFVEASKGVEKLLPEGNQPPCQIEGTSYAAPIMSANLVNFLNNAGGNLPDAEGLYESSKKIHPDHQYFSNYLANCNNP